MNDRATKKCPFCGEEIKAEAIKCRYCREFLDTASPQPPRNIPQPQLPASPVVPASLQKPDDAENISEPPEPKSSIPESHDDKQANEATGQPAAGSNIPSDLLTAALFFSFVAIMLLAWHLQPKCPETEESAFKNVFLSKAEKGDSNAQFNLGYGFLVLGKNEEAVKWLTLAAPEEVDAAVFLAWCYRDGVGVPKDFEKAFKVLKTAVDKGKKYQGLFESAVFSLGRCYWDGIGCEKNEAEAVRQFQRLVPPRKDIEGAIAFLNAPWLGGVPPYLAREDVRRFEKQVTVKVKHIDTDFLTYVLGECYFFGRAGLPQDHKMAVKYLRHSNIPEAKTLLAICEIWNNLLWKNFSSWFIMEI